MPSPTSHPDGDASGGRPLLDAAALDQLRRALGDYTVDGVTERLGPVGAAALDRADLAGVEHVLRHGGEPLDTLIRLFVLGADVEDTAAANALAPLPLDAAISCRLVSRTAGSVRAELDVRPYAQDGQGDNDPPWWVVSDLGADVRGGPLPGDHVLGIGRAALTLAQAVPRGDVERALDIGTGCGVQALHLGRHADHVTVTDVSSRALTLAATTAALSGQSWAPRHGSLLEPVRDERFDLIVANPPFVVSGGEVDFAYRDGGMTGDGISESLVRSLPGALRPGGSAHLLANWILDADGDWRGRVGSWLAGAGCDAWVRQREVVEPGEYVTLWLRDAGFDPRMPDWAPRYARWRAWLEAHGVVAIGMGQVSLWQTDDPVVQVLEDVPQAVEQPLGAHLPAWLHRRRWVARHTDAALLDSVLAAAPDLVRERADLLSGDAGWATAASTLRQSHGMRWSVDVDDSIAALVAGCDGQRPLRLPLLALAAALGRNTQEVAAAALPVVRDLVARGFLIPTEPVTGTRRPAMAPPRRTT